MADVQRRGGPGHDAISYAHIAINPRNLSCVHRIMSYNVSAFHHLGVINPVLSLLTSQ